MSYWRDRECPTDSRDAYYEGRRSEEWQRNPYEHGRDAFASHSCREAHDEWERGHRAAEYDREMQREEEQAERRRQQRREYERQQEEAAYYEAMERAHHEEMERQYHEQMQAEQADQQSNS